MRNLNEIIIEKLTLNNQSKLNDHPKEDPIKNVSDKDQHEWIAIEIVTTDNSYSSKQTVNQRVVTVDTYHNLKNGNHTKGYRHIVSVTALGPACKSKDNAMNYLDPPKKTKRKSKIDKKGADYIVWCIPCGKMNPSGKTYWDWNFWDEWKNDTEIFIGDYGSSFLMGSTGSLKVGDTVFCIDNDSEKKLPGAPRKIEAISKCDIDDFRDVYRKTYPSYCKKPIRAFGKMTDGLPWSGFHGMKQFYSIKGIATDA